MFKKLMFLCTISATFLMACATDSGSAKPADVANLHIGYRLEKDKVYKLNSTLKTTLSVNADKKKGEMTISGDMTYKVLAASEDNFTLLAKYESFFMDFSEISPQIGVIDSKKMADDNPFKPFLTAILSTPFELSMKENGEVSGVKSDELLNKIMESGKAELSDNFNGASLKESLNSTFFIYPPTPLEKGKTSWNRKTTISNVFDIDANYKIKSIEAETFTIVVDGKLTVNIAEAPKLGESTYKGSFTVDKKTGWIRKGEVTMLIEIAEGPEAGSVTTITTLSGE
jgi:hypothetical protein